MYHLPPCGAPANERRYDTKTNRPESQIPWRKIKKNTPEVIDIIEGAATRVIRDRGYPASAAVIAKGLALNGFVWPVNLNGRDPGTVLATLLDGGYFQNLQYADVDDLPTVFVWHGGVPSFHFKWIEATTKIREGKIVRLH